MSSVAVVHVPVDDRDALEPELRLREPRGDRDRVEEAEAHRLTAFGVVAGWTGKCEAAAPNRLDRCACGEQGRLEGRLGADRVRVDQAACRPHELDQLWGVASQHVALVGRLTLDVREALVQRDDPPLRLGMLPGRVQGRERRVADEVDRRS